MVGSLARRVGSALHDRGAFGPPGSLRRQAMEKGWVLYHRIARPTFNFGGKRYRYLCHRGNKAWTNERTVEIPIAEDVMNSHPTARMLEVGNVLHNYFPEHPHDVVDLYEKAPGVLNVDIVDFVPKERYELIISISTLEHVGWDEPTAREPGKTLRAYEHLRDRCLAPGGTLFVSMPLGYNHDMDAALRAGKFRFTREACMRKVSALNEWTEASWDDVKGATYNLDWWCANAIALGWYEDPRPRAGNSGQI